VSGYERFWYGFAISRLKLTLFRIAFFSMVGLDAFRQIEHAPRYGAGDFNVSHVPLADWLLSPSREGILLVFLLQCYLAFRVAFGSATRRSVQLLAALYGYGYFVSQLDSYQHHYLVFLLLVVCSFVPWDGVVEPAAKDDEKPARKDPRKDQKTAKKSARVAFPGGEVYSWALRLIYVQLAVVYAWAAVSKMGPLWVDGTTLAAQIQEDWARDLIEGLFGKATPGDPGGFSIAAKIVIVTELALPILVIWRKLWVVALPVGVAFHLGVEMAGLKIGLFSYLMCAVYLLMVPEWVLSYLSMWFGKPVTAAIDGAREAVHSLASIAATVAAIIVGCSVLLILPYPIMWLFILICAGLAAATALAPQQRERTVRAAHAVGAAHLAVCLIIVTLHWTTDQSFNYYKYWAGSARRLGPPELAREAYIDLTDLHPDYGPGHYHLGNIYLKDKEPTKALESYAQAIERAPDDYRPHVGQAIVYTRAGKGSKAYESATRALELKPNDQQAKRIQDRFAEFAPQSVIDAP
jgi:hypothetical protein